MKALSTAETHRISGASPMTFVVSAMSATAVGSAVSFVVARMSGMFESADTRSRESIEAARWGFQSPSSRASNGRKFY